MVTLFFRKFFGIALLRVEHWLSTTLKEINTFEYRQNHISIDREHKHGIYIEKVFVKLLLTTVKISLYVVSAIDVNGVTQGVTVAEFYQEIRQASCGKKMKITYNLICAISCSYAKKTWSCSVEVSTTMKLTEAIWLTLKWNKIYLKLKFLTVSWINCFVESDSWLHIVSNIERSLRVINQMLEPIARVAATNNTK